MKCTVTLDIYNVSECEITFIVSEVEINADWSK